MKSPTRMNLTLDYLYEPSAAEVLAGILPHYVHFQVYQMVLDSRASEHSARMVAMKNATDNAKQLIKDLTLEYNKIRQASITTELLEITTASGWRSVKQANPLVLNHVQCHSYNKMNNTGTIVQVIGPVVDVDFYRQSGRTAENLRRHPDRLRGHGQARQAHPRGPAAPWRELGPRHRDVFD